MKYNLSIYVEYPRIFSKVLDEFNKEKSGRR